MISHVMVTPEIGIGSLSNNEGNELNDSDFFSLVKFIKKYNTHHWEVFQAKIFKIMIIIISHYSKANASINTKFGHCRVIISNKFGVTSWWNVCM